MTALRLAANPAVSPLFAARLLSSAGVGFGQVALVWGMKDLGYSPSAISLVVACKGLPAVLILAGGVLGDRFKRHHVLAAAELLASVTWLAIGACLLTGHSSVPGLCVLALMSGTAYFLFLPAVRGVTADLLPPDRRQAGNALVGQTEATGLLIGLASAGIVVGSLGPAFAAGLKGGLSALGLVLLLRLDAPRRVAGKPRPIADLGAGWAYFAAHRWMWMMTVQFTTVIMATATFIEIIGPLYMSQHGHGASEWGLVAAAEALGALAGAALALRWKPHRPIFVAVSLLSLTALPMMLVGSGAPWTVVALGMLMSGVAKAVYLTLWITELQKILPIETLARVNAWSIVPAYFMAPIALALSGRLVELDGPASAAVVVGINVLLATTAVLLSRTWQPTERSSPTPQ
ncbi:MFS transporter [Actinomadura barringtoniae]|uniref:MFS transporter n=1 Tax=Actinomadura barringtoniae TaxID=1427535 RepID=A0A939P7R1_9ACTN|nr:MFS transporter [Actinomadura barringtoniae]MBO2447090.1 MFS transporter [Actinomadura barringtoniae]